jgi:hypothetical protein
LLLPFPFTSASWMDNARVDIDYEENMQFVPWIAARLRTILSIRVLSIRLNPIHAED